MHRLSQATKVYRLPQEPFHLTCPGPDGHIEHLLPKFHHQPTKNTGINLAYIETISFALLVIKRVHKNDWIMDDMLYTFCSILTVFPRPITSCSVSLSSFSSSAGRGWQNRKNNQNRYLFCSPHTKFANGQISYDQSPKVFALKLLNDQSFMDHSG